MTDPLDVRFMLFNLNIEQPFTAPVISTGGDNTSPPDKNWGFKLSKTGKDTGSNDMRDFLVHSSARSPMVHAVVPFTIGAGGSYTYTHDLTYNPIFFVYTSFNSSDKAHSYSLTSQYMGVTTQGNTITVTNSSSGTLNYSLIILQDPFLIASNIINVSV
jgi:hypothetical protein